MKNEKPGNGAPVHIEHGLGGCPYQKDIKAVIREALARHEDGARKYGPLDFDRDTRDFISEAIDELLDCINYAAYEIKSSG